MREGYKKTEVGVIPEDWEVKRLEEIAKICYGKSQKEVECENGQFKILGTGGVMGYTNSFLWDKPSVLIGRKGTIDKPQYIDEPFWTVDTLFYTKINNKNLPKWFYYYMNNIDLKKYNEATGVPSLSVANLNTIKIITPPLKEQEKISEIISTVDSQIDDTEKLIEKFNELKKGLMQKLLTKGIDHSEFKKTELGEIPASWEVEKISNITNLIKSGLSRKLSDENIGIPCLRSNNIKENKLTLDDLKYWYLVDDKGANISDYILDCGDIIMNFINSPSQIGKGCIFNKKNSDCIYSTNLLRIKINEEKMLTKFFYYYTQTERYKKEIMLITKPAVNQASFTTTEFKEIKFPVPTIKEQNKIVDILSSVDKNIDEYESKKQKLEELKKGLMQQLLTGKIRV